RLDLRGRRGGRGRRRGRRRGREGSGGDGCLRTGRRGRRRRGRRLAEPLAKEFAPPLVDRVGALPIARQEIRDVARVVAELAAQIFREVGGLLDGHERILFLRLVRSRRRKTWRSRL